MGPSPNANGRSAGSYLETYKGGKKTKVVCELGEASLHEGAAASAASQVSARVFDPSEVSPLPRAQGEGNGF